MRQHSYIVALAMATMPHRAFATQVQRMHNTECKSEGVNTQALMTEPNDCLSSPGRKMVRRESLNSKPELLRAATDDNQASTSTLDEAAITNSILVDSAVKSEKIREESILDIDLAPWLQLPDSKLAPISTPGKVNASAIDGALLGGSIAINTTGFVATSGAFTLQPLNGTPSRILFKAQYHLGLAAPEILSTSIQWQWPIIDGANQAILSTDGAGVMVWRSLAPAGSLDVGNKKTNLVRLVDDNILPTLDGRLLTNLRLDQAVYGDSSITNAKLSDAAVSNLQIQANAVDSSKLADGSIQASDLANASINSLAILDATITAPDIAINAIQRELVADNAVDGAKLASDSVTSAKIQDAAVLATKLAPSSVTMDKITANAVDSSHFAPASITAQDVSFGAVTQAKLAANSVTTGAISASAVTQETLAAGAINHATLMDQAVTSEHIAPSAVTQALIAAQVVGQDALTPQAVTSNKIAPAAVVADSIAANSIDGQRIYDTAQVRATRSVRRMEST